MGQALHISGGLVSQIGAGILGVNVLDANSGGAISIGSTAATTAVNVGTNANNASVTLGGAATTAVGIGTGAANKTINIGSAGDTINIGDEAPGVQTVTLNIKANMTVQGTEHVVGGTTFDADVTLGDAAGDVILLNGEFTFSGSGTVASDIRFKAGAGRQIYIPTAAGAGDQLSVVAGAAAAGGAGGNLVLGSGAGQGAGNGGDLILRTGAAGGTGVVGSTYFGPAGNIDLAAAYQLLTNATDNPGLRYDGLNNKWQLKNNAVDGWKDIAWGTPTIDAGNATNDHLYWDGTKWTWEVDLKMAAGQNVMTINGNTQGALTVHAMDVLAGALAGGVTTIRGGNGLLAGAGGALVLAGGSTGAGGTGGNTSVRGGAGALANGNVLLGDSNTVGVYFGSVANGIGYTAGTGVLKANGTGVINLITTAGTELQFNGVATPNHANIIGTNFVKLFDGSNADALHVHAAAAATSCDIAMTVGTAAANDCCYVINNAGTANADKADNTATATAAKAKSIGVYGQSGANTVRVAGLASVVCEDVSVPGNDVYLSETTLGRVQVAVPNTATRFLTYVGTVKVGGGAGATISIVVNPDRPIAL